MYWIVTYLFLLMVNQCICDEDNQNNPPHIIFIYADDMGWNDVSFHGSPEVPTPNIDALALSGITLQNYYAEWICTASRGALMTGQYPIRLGLQHRAIAVGESSGLPLNFTILPQHLQKLGYETHMVGKWHLGFHKRAYMPTQRGFKTFIGFLNGDLDYYDYTNNNDGYVGIFGDDSIFFGVDLYNGTEPITDFRKQYATEFLAETASDIILSHDPDKPLFLYLPQIAVHASGSSQRVQAPPEVVRNFKYIKDKNRRVYAGMTSVLDDSVGMIFEALNEKSMLENSIILFLSDNGADVVPKNGGYGTNYPLRGNKMTLWEGGVRVPGIIWSPLLNLEEPKISNDLMHVTDWLPTLYRAAGGDPSDLGDIDGHDMWEVLTDNSQSSRTDLLHNIDPIYGASSYRSGDLKIVNGSSAEAYNVWYGPTGFKHVSPKSMDDWVFKNGSTVREILTDSGMWIAENPDDWYKRFQVVCQQPPPESAASCDPDIKPCLFNITADPCEYIDVADIYPEVVSEMMGIIDNYQKVAVPPQTKPRDHRADPACHDFTFVPWLEPEFYSECDFLL